ncbi:HesB/IscA family protein [Radicibacter daui]|uniref:HesB/IscA family protein n=1 Tax=Radicibacter daui TaxID=3064829 RepID=UPI0040468D4F
MTVTSHETTPAAPAKPRRERPKAVTLTEAAAERIREIIENSEKPVVGLRVGVKARGCSGNSYDITYAEEKKPWDEVVEDKGVTILIDATALMFVLGTEIDWQEDKLQSGFVFNNPNVKATCGCGESFHV